MTQHQHDLTPLLVKLSGRSQLNHDDREAILALPHDTLIIEAGEYIVREGERSTHCHVMLKGFAHRHKIVGNGGRQIVGIHMAGDITDMSSTLSETADSNVQALTSARVAAIPRIAMLDAIYSHPAIAQAMWIEALAETSMFREWMASIGRRDARGRIAHILCELRTRQHAADLCRIQSGELRMTQEELGDAVGLPAVHVNRTLSSLEQEGLIQRDAGSISIKDWEAMARIGDFNPEYLHFAKGDESKGPCPVE